MDLARIFGPPYHVPVARSGLVLRSITTDLEVLLDALDAMMERWEAGGALRDAGATVTDSFTSIRGNIPAEKIFDLGVHDRNHLNVQRNVQLSDGSSRYVSISCSAGQVDVYSPQADEDRMFVVDYIVKNSTPRPMWARFRYLLVLLVVVAMLVGYVGVLLTAELGGFALLLLTAVVGIGAAGSTAWAVRLYRAYGRADGSIRVRGQSRRETNADRANRWANVKVSLVTAIVVAPVTLFLSWLSSVIEN